MSENIIGFSGTRRGLTPNQLTVVRGLLKLLRAGEVHHGDCVGADEQVHEIAKELGLYVTIHPPTDPKWRAYCRSAEQVETPAPYLVRNRDIVEASDIVICAPKETHMLERGSGTWATWRYATKAGRPTFLVLPSGQLSMTIGDE